MRELKIDFTETTSGIVTIEFDVPEDYDFDMDPDNLMSAIDVAVADAISTNDRVVFDHLDRDITVLP